MRVLRASARSINVIEDRSLIVRTPIDAKAASIFLAGADGLLRFVFRGYTFFDG